MVALHSWIQFTASMTATALLMGPVGPTVAAQTFVQVPELSPERVIGPRITETIAMNRLNRHLFASLDAKVTFIDALLSPPRAYEFSSDGAWSRVLFGEKDEYIYAFTNVGSSTLRLLGPGGVDISATRTLFIADQLNGRVVLARFNAAAKSLAQVAVTPNDPDLGGVVDVAWDGSVTPLTTEFFYALDGAGKVSYWTWSGSGTPAKQWVTGSNGVGQGQFNGPSGICVGRAVGSSGGSVFTLDFYIADRWNKRIVQMQQAHPAIGPLWVRSVTLPDAGEPSDCTVDHFGNVIVSDVRNSRLLKFTSSLELLSQYGSYGVGAVNNTFAKPNAVHVPFGTKRNASGQTIWYGEGRVLTAEKWSAGSGAREHYFGLELFRTSGPTTSDGLTTLGYRVTDHSHHRVWVRAANNVVVRQLRDYPTLMPSGTHTVVWDGRKDDGTGAAPGYYYFNVFAYSDYGCTWCNKSIVSSSFWFAGLPCNPPATAFDPLSPHQEARPPIAMAAQQPCNPTTPEFAAGPGKAFLHQRVFGEPRILTRVAAAEASAPSVESPADGGRLSDLVRAYGVTGLSFGVPDNAAGTTVTIRVYTSAARLVRMLVNEPMPAGFYEIGWDEFDDRGRAVAPGVYFAVLTMGTERVTQRLLIRH